MQFVLEKKINILGLWPWLSASYEVVQNMYQVIPFAIDVYVDEIRRPGVHDLYILHYMHDEPLGFNQIPKRCRKGAARKLAFRCVFWAKGKNVANVGAMAKIPLSVSAG